VDVARARADTPGCSEVLHFNNAGAALMPRPVLDAVVDHLRLEAATGGYEAADAAAGAIERTYAALADLLGCTTDEIAVVENATRAWDMAFYSFRFEPGDRILTARAEYASNFIAYLQVASHTGASVEAVPNDSSGQVSIDALECMMDSNVKLISMTHVPTNSGLVNPAEAVGRVARTWKVPFLLDACQSVGQLVTRVDDLGCDILSGTGRKYLRGPRGTGFLYVRKSLIEKLEPPFLDLHAAEWLQPDRYTVRGDARRFENWESNVAGKIGLGVAVQYALDIGLQSIQERVATLAEHFRRELARVHSVRLHDPGQQRCGIVTFTLGDVSPEVVRRRLAEQRINVTTSSRASTILDMDDRQLDKVVRASVHYYNTEEEVARFCTALTTLAE
jgi:selenocysteine lyase/cysteine desulfurase